MIWISACGHRDRHAEEGPVAGTVAWSRPPALRGTAGSGRARRRCSDVTTATTRICASCDAVSTNITLARSARRSGGAGRRIRHRRERRARPTARRDPSLVSGAFMIGRNRSIVTVTTNTAAISERNSSASHRRRREIVAAISHTGELKKTRNVNSSTGSARTNSEPAAARCDIVVRAVQPRIDPAPVAVSSQDDGDDDAPRRSGRPERRALGPPRTPPATATATATVAATVRAAHGGDARHPPADDTAIGSTRTTSRQDEPFGPGRLALDVDGVLARDGHDERGIGHEDRECRPAPAPTAATAAEPAHPAAARRAARARGTTRRPPGALTRQS